MKHDTYEKYVAMDTDLPQRALLTAWDCLCQYHDSLPVGTIPGINRALEKHRWVDITGKTLVGSEMTQSIKVAEVGPMLALKLNAFGGPKGRKSPKDAHDIFYLANNYLEGVDAAILAFREERAAGNYAVTLAEAALKNYFLDDEAEGPLACVAFRMNSQHDLPEFAEESLQLRQQCVTLALELLS